MVRTGMKSPWYDYAGAITLVAIAALARWSFPGVLADTPFLAFYPAVIAATILGGFGPGMVATVASTLCYAIWFSATPEGFRLDSGTEWLRIAIFFAGGTATSSLAQWQRRAQAGQRESKERLQLALAASDLGWWHWDFTTDFLDGDEKVSILIGLPAHEPVQSFHRVLDRTHPDDQGYLQERAAALKAQPGDYEAEFRVTWPDGSLHWLLAKGRSFHTADGKPVSAMGIAMDITPRKQAEDALRESERRFRTMADAIPQLAWIAKADGWIFWYNDRWYEYTGTTPKQMEGWGWQSVHDPRTLPAVLEQWKAAIAQGQPFDMTFPLRGADGIFRPFLTRAMPLKDEQGRVLQWFGTNTDVSKQREAEAEREQNHESMQRLVEVSKAVVGEKSLTGLLQTVADAARELTGARVASSGHGYIGGSFMVGAASRDEGFPACPLGQTFVIKKGGVFMDLIEKADSLRLTDEQMRKHPAWWGLPKDHVPMCGLLGVKLTNAEGKANGTIMVSCKREGDFTEQDEAILKQLGAITSLALQHVEAREATEAAKDSAERAKAAAEHANRAKDHFLAVLSHELRTPLTPVVMGVSMLQDRPDLEPKAQETLEMIHRNVEMEARLIDDLLDITRIARGKIELNRSSVELCTVIDRAVEVCKPDIEARDLHFGVDVGPSAPYWIDADVPRLQQVFWNLLKNAIKFTPHGVCVGIRCQPNDSQVLIEFSDSGIGIEPDALSRVFNAFEQEERSITRQFGGLGLGLTISKALVELHGGTISAHSEGKDKGTTFRILLPLTAPAGQSEKPAPTTPPRRLTLPLRILLVEDHGVTAKIMQMMLSVEGHTVERAGDIATAVRMAENNAYDLLLSDLGLPDGSGHDLMRQLRQRGRLSGGTTRKRSGGRCRAGWALRW